MKRERRIRVPRFNLESGFETNVMRSQLMSKIRGIETESEVTFRKALWHSGIRYRKNYKLLPGKPDIYIKKYNLVIFIDGEFWHGYKWEEKKKKLKSNRKFWIPKIERNMQRDKENNIALKKLGLRVIRFWESEIKKDIEKCIDKVLAKIY